MLLHRCASFLFNINLKFMRKIYVVLVLLVCVCFSAFAQPTVLYSSINTTPRVAMNDLGAFRQGRMLANQTGYQRWAFHIGSVGSPDYSNNWRVGSTPNVLSFGNFIPAGFANGANYFGGGGTDGELNSVVSGNYYTFNVMENGAANSNMELLETNFNPAAITSVTQSPLAASVAANNAVIVTINMASAPAVGENVFVRYTTNGYTTSTLLQATFVGSIGTVYIPCQAATTVVSYYVFSSNENVASINSDVVSFGNNSYDLATLSLNNNAGTNYNYTVGAISTNFSGAYFIPSSCYGTLATFITALNAGTVTGPVTVNVAAGYTETAPVGGYQITKAGTSVNTITFQKFGAGANPTFTAFTPQATGTISDAIFKIRGADFITIDAFTIRENPSNATTGGASPTSGSTGNNMTEFGIALFYNTTTDGAQNNTIRNCIISLDKTYTNTFGIYSNTNHDITLVTTSIATAAGINANNKIYTNNISNVNIAIALIGNSTFFDAGNDMGGTASPTGNTISNQGSGGSVVSAGAFTGYPSGTMAILVSNCTGATISFNSISSNATPVSGYGIYLRNGAASSPTITHTTNINNNTITLASSSTTTSSLVAILNEIGGSAHTFNVKNNVITGCTTSASFAGGFGAVWSGFNTGLLGDITGNTVSNNTISGTTLATSTAARSAFFKVTSTAIGTTVANNICTNNLFTNTGVGDIVVFDINGAYTGACNITSNTVNGLSTTGAGSIYGYSNITNPSGALTVSNNTFLNISITGTGTSSVIKFVNSNSSSVNNSQTIFGNTIRALSINPTIASTGITAIDVAVANVQSIYNNTITNLSSGASNVGILSRGGGTTTLNINGNIIDTLVSTGLTSFPFHNGIQTSTSANIFGNIVKNIDAGATSSTSTVYGIWQFGGTLSTIYNNFISDLKSPAGTNAGMVIQGLRSSSTTTNIYNNSVYLKATSSGASFGTACLGIGSTTTATLNNNIFVNESIATGTQYTAAIVNLSSAYATGVVPANITTTSNNNCLFASGFNSVIYKDIENSTLTQQNRIYANCFDLATYKAYMIGGRETNSISEIPPFYNTVATKTDLHLSGVVAPAVATAPTSGCVNGGTTIGAVTTDIDGTSRPIGGIYEIGADEIAGTTADRTPPTITYTAIADVGCVSTTILTATITDANTLGSSANAPRLYYKKLSDATNTIATANTNAVNGWKFVVTPTLASPYSFTFDYSLLPSGLLPGDVIQYFVAAQDVSGNVATTNAAIAPCVTTVVFINAQTVSAPPVINQFTYRAGIGGTVLIGTGQTYTTLSGVGGLFDAINKGYVTADITATVTSNTVETGVVALNEWAEYNASPTCTLKPISSYRLIVQSDGTQWSLVGTDLLYNATTLQAMINLNGVDRVTFTGGTGAQRLLVFRSTNIAAASCVPVFQLGNGNGDTSIIIKNCDIQTNGNSSVTPIGAGIYLTATGTNSSILINNNDLHDAVLGTAGNMRYGMYAENNLNTTVQITDNKFYNINTNAIALGQGATPSIGNGQSITGNSIYSTGVGAYNAVYNCIDVRGTTASGHTISNNVIGGTSSNGGTTGNPFVGSATIGTFRGIYLPYHAFTTSTTISNNRITNINLTNVTGAAFSGIDFTGLVNCNLNTVGHASDPAMGITIGATTSTAASNNYGILGGSGTAVTGINFTNNTVKYIKHNTAGAVVTNSRLIGIYNWFTGAISITLNINNNTVAEMSSNMKNVINLYATGSAYATGGILCGILSGTGSSSNIDIKNNTVFNLSNTGVNSTNIPNVIGIAVDGSTPSNIASNRIYGLTNQSPGSAANGGFIAGIRLQPSTSSVTNNMITLTNGANLNRSRIIGIFDNANNLDVYHNSIYIGGDQTAFGTTGICSAPYASIAGSGTHNVKNNIFQNVRTTTGGLPSGVNFHYALAVTATAPTVVSNYNDLVAADVTKLCLYNITSYALASWQGLGTPNPVTPDVNSITTVPVFVDQPNGDLHLDPTANCAIVGRGIAIGTVTTDYDNETRKTGASPNGPEIGADEVYKVTNWLGVNTAWNNVANWSNGVVPNSVFTNVLIPNIANLPVINTGDAWQTGNVTIATDATLTNNGALAVAGALSVVTTGKVNSVDGTIILNSKPGCFLSAQTLSGAAFINSTIKNLKIDNEYTVNPVVSLNATAGDTLKITGTVSFGNVNSKTLATNGNLTLVSTATATASIGDLTNVGVNSGNTVTGVVNIERYIKAVRAWRFLSTPIASGSTQTIKQAYMENSALPASGAGNGYGTQITGPLTGVDAVVGADVVSIGTSMKYYNPVGIGSFVSIGDVNNTLARPAGYFVFVRGDRGTYNGSASIPTTLRMKGDIITGDVLFDNSAELTGFIPIGNPYPSAVNMIGVNKTGGFTGSVESYTIWNPNPAGANTYGVGKYEQYINLTPGGGNFTLNGGGGTPRNFLESGQAVFMQATTAVASTITFKEKDKSNAALVTLNRGGEDAGRAGVLDPTLEINLYAKDASGNVYKADGTLQKFADNNSNIVDRNDVRKVLNSADNLFISNNNQKLIFERRKTLVDSDTIFLNLTSTRVAPYKFVIDPSVLGNTGLKAILKDKFLQSETAVSLTDSTTIDFNITADAASKVADRFMIVFKQIANPQFTTIAAVRNADKTVKVNWGVQNELSITNYSIEHSTDGINFTAISTKNAIGNNGSNQSYSIIDAAATKGNNWYRVKANIANSAAKYTAIAMVGALPADAVVTPMIAVYPNPVTDGKLIIKFANNKGAYTASLVNAVGQTMLTTAIKITTEQEMKTIVLADNILAGKYTLVLVDADGNKQSIAVLVK
jgi:hypothetical protein